MTFYCTFDLNESGTSSIPWTFEAKDEEEARIRAIRLARRLRACAFVNLRAAHSARIICNRRNIKEKLPAYNPEDQMTPELQKQMIDDQVNAELRRILD